MTNKFFLWIVVLLPVFSASHAQSKIDTSQYVVFPADSSLTQSDINAIETLLAQCIDSFNTVQMKIYDSVNRKRRKPRRNETGVMIDLTNYKRQFISIKNTRGEKEVWVNCFCKESKKNYWRKDIVRVEDGGACFFNVMINLTIQKYYDLDVHGPG